MSQIMTKPCKCHISDLVICDSQVWLLPLKDLHLLLGQVAHSNAMLKPFVSRRWKHLVRYAQLLQVLHPFELRCVHNIPAAKTSINQRGLLTRCCLIRKHHELGRAWFASMKRIAESAWKLRCVRFRGWGRWQWMISSRWHPSLGSYWCLHRLWYKIHR